MSVQISSPVEQNVVNVGDELTSAQLAALQNAQGASASNPCLTRTNTFNTADAAVRITQEGTGEAFRVEDSTNPDSTPFVITASGWVGIGTTSIANPLTVSGRAVINSSSGGGGDPALAVINSGTGAVPALNVQVTTSISSTSSVAIFSNHANATADCVRITNLGTGNSFVVEDEANPDNTPFVINNAGNVGIGTGAVAGRKLTVFGQTDMYANDSGTILKVANNSTGISAEFTNTTNATSDCVRITNLGTGNSFVVEDSTNPDASPFVINADGNIGIGRTPTTRKVEISGQFAVTGICLFENNFVGSADLFSFTNTNTSNSGSVVVIDNRGTGNSFVVRDEASDTTPFVIAANGDVTLGGSLTLESAAYNANTALVIDNTNYPHELTFKVGSTTYRVPARAI